LSINQNIEFHQVFALILQSVISFLRNDTREAKRIKWLIATFLFCVLVLIAVLIVPWARTWQILVHSNVTLIIFGLLLVFPFQLLYATSYYIIARKQNAGLGLWQIYIIDLIMVFYDIVLPSTFFVSSLRWYRYNKFAKKPAETLTSLTYLKLFNILLTLLLSTGLLLFFNTLITKEYYFGVTALIIGCALLLYFIPIMCRALLAKLNRYPNLDSSQSYKGLFFKYLKLILNAFTEFQNLTFETQLILIVLIVASQLIQYFQYVLFAESVGIHLTFAQLGALRATLLLVANLPINFSIGIGLRDVTLVSLLVLLNVPLDQAVAMSIVALMKQYFFGLLGALIEGINLIKMRLTA
jgi:uncharacterized membrane protein YbhN (UPF0104 family)